MGLYDAPEGTEVSTVGPDGVEIRVHFEGKPRDVKDEYLDQIMQTVAADPRNPVSRVKEGSRRKTSPVRVPKATADQEE
jgi:hypothetical protein